MGDLSRPPASAEPKPLSSDDSARPARLPSCPACPAATAARPGVKSAYMGAVAVAVTECPQVAETPAVSCRPHSGPMTRATETPPATQSKYDESGAPSHAWLFGPTEVNADLDLIMWSLKLASIRRYFHQRYWEKETTESEFASRVECGPRLESVADHSWHVADTVMLLAPRFESIDCSRAVMLAILHDKMEISTGDISPVGRDGTGTRTHAFNAEARERKDQAEREAIATYLARVGDAARPMQASLLDELLNGRSDEARFVKAVDKLQALAYVIAKKSGRMSDSHLLFTMQYTSKVALSWPPLQAHLTHLLERLFVSIARVRNVSTEAIRKIAYTEQLRLF